MSERDTGMSTINDNNNYPQDFGRVAVLYGGTSPERQVSLKSGKMVFDALKQRGIETVLIDAGHDLVEQLMHARPGRVFLALHGGDGENGTVQGLLDMMHIPYTGSGVKASALAMDKNLSKLIWNGLNLPTPMSHLVTAQTNLAALDIPLPCFIKPNGDGSSVCTFPAFTREEFITAVTKVLMHSSEALVETLINGPEYTVAILDGKPLPAIRLETDSAFYDYEAKYLSNDTRYYLPSGLSTEKEREIQALALQAFESLGCEGWGRVDIMQDSSGQFWLLEVNTSPGMTDHSLVPMAARATGLEFDDLVVELLAISAKKERPWMPVDTSSRATVAG